jgi:AraC family transcriptional regulator
MAHPDPTPSFFGTPLLEWRGGQMLVAEHLYQPFQRIDRHEHGRAYVCVVLSGHYLERCEAGERECRAGSVLIHPAGSTHSDCFGGGNARLLMVEMQPGQHDQFIEPQLIESGPASAIGARFHEEISHPDDVTPLAIEGLTLELIAVAHRQRAHCSRRPPPWLRSACERIDGALPERVGIRALALGVGVHPSHFTRVFRAHFGGTVADYVRRRRIGIAKHAIALGRTLAEAALEAGFADQSDLTRAFRRVEGMTPARFRRRS